MASVTQRIKQIRQPEKGYLPTSFFQKSLLPTNTVLYDNENIHASLIGMAVDYLTRHMMGVRPREAFQISLLGAENAGLLSYAEQLCDHVYGLSDTSIICACKLCGFDVCYRSSLKQYKPVEDINPNQETICNIRTMVERTLSFFQMYGPIVSLSPTFEGGYSLTVDSGDGDFVTNDTLWDLKVLKSGISSKHTLQLLMYYIMGRHSVYPQLHNLTNLGFFNPRLNTVYICPISSIHPSIIQAVEYDVICYHITDNEWLPLIDACHDYNIHIKTMMPLLKKNSIQHIKNGSEYLINRSSLEAYLKQEKKQRIELLIISVVLSISILIVFIICFRSTLNF